MSDPVLMESVDLAKLKSELQMASDDRAQLRRELTNLSLRIGEVREAANRLKIENGQLKKALPSDKVQAELKSLRGAVSDAHKRIGVLEKELAAAQAESEARRKEVAKGLSRLESVQGTFDTLQAARNKAQADRDQALDAVGKSAEAYHKLSAEFDAFKKAAAEAKQPQQQKQAKVQEPAKV